MKGGDRALDGVTTYFASPSFCGHYLINAMNNVAPVSEGNYYENITSEELESVGQLITYVDWYLEEGFCPIPLDGSTLQPLVSDWRQYGSYEARADIEDFQRWHRQWPDMQLGAVTGRDQMLVVIQVRNGGDVSRWPTTTCSKTGDGGTNLFYWHPTAGSFVQYSEAVKVPNTRDILPLTDVIGDDSFVVLPSYDGKDEWIVEPNDWDYRHLSDNEICLIVRDPAFEITNPPDLLREEAAKQFILELLQRIPNDGKELVATLWEKFRRWNVTYDGAPVRNLTPSIGVSAPYDETKLREFFDEHVGSKDAVQIMNAPFPQPNGDTIYFLTSVYNPTERTSAEILQTANDETDTGSRNGKGPSQSTRLVNMVSDDSRVVLFKDEYSVAHVRIPVGDHTEVWPCKSSAFTRWLGGEYYRLMKGSTVAGREAVKDAIGLLEGRAINECPEHKLYNRIAQTPDAIWYDLGDAQFRAVRVTREGWSVVTDVPLLFRRFSHLAPQVEPTRGGSVDEVLKFVNVTGEDQKILFLVHLVASFIPGWPHPALYVYGTQGSAKSTLSRIDRMLIDPSRIEVVSLTRKEEELAQQLGHHNFLSFDNVSEMPDWIADLLCRAITGGGFSKRELYTNDDDVIRYVMANIGINGINLASNRADLLERCLLLKLERMKDRKQEHELMADFELARPKILGAIFDTVAKAMTLQPSIKVDELPRMADFALWGCAAAEALGIGQDAFLKAYSHNISSQSEELINDNTVATLIRGIVDSHDGKWEGNPTQLFKTFKDQAITEQIMDKRLPANPAALMRELNRLKTPFEEMGYQITSASDRTVTIRNMAMPDPDAPQE